MFWVWLELFQTGWSKFCWLQQAQRLTLIDDGQTTIHPMMKLDAAAGEVKADWYFGEGEGVAKESDGLVPGDGTRIGKADTLVGLGARQSGAIG